MFEGFALEDVDVGAVTLRVRHDGRGPAVLLLHGHPRTHVTWHRVTPLLADGFTVVCPDLRGYGHSSKPPSAADHAPYSKRAMAQDCAQLPNQVVRRRAFCGLDYPAGDHSLAPLKVSWPLPPRPFREPRASIKSASVRAMSCRRLRSCLKRERFGYLRRSQSRVEPS